MPDAAGYRIKFGVIVPSTNTVVEADYNRIAPPGVTFHTGRMYIEHPVMDSDATSRHCSPRSAGPSGSRSAT